jgi:hypothetical protein
MLVSYPWERPSNKFVRCARNVAKKYGWNPKKALLVSFVPPLGAVPIDLLDVYPVGKITMSYNLDEETLNDTIEFSRKILKKFKVITISDNSWQAEKILSIRTRPGEGASINLFKEGLRKDTQEKNRKKKSERKEKS